MSFVMNVFCYVMYSAPLVAALNIVTDLLLQRGFLSWCYEPSSLVTSSVLALALALMFQLGAASNGKFAGIFGK
jgi:hypothetical protein